MFALHMIWWLLMPNYQQTLLWTSHREVMIPPASTKLKGGYTGITLSVCLSVDRIVSALYLQQCSSDLFHICTSYQATSEGVSRVMPISKFKNFRLLLTWDPIWPNGMIIMRRRGVSSERRRSSCSSFISVSFVHVFVIISKFPRPYIYYISK